jgi:phosphoribosylglycinamide formyltransferase 1
VTPIFQPRAERPMHVACFMSGSGTNLVKILEYQKAAKERLGQTIYEVKLIFTDNPDSKARIIGAEFGIPVITSDIMEFYRAHGLTDKRDLTLRPEFDAKTVSMISGYEIDCVALAGYMSVVTGPLLERFDGRIINVHPADLRVKDGMKRRYTGDRAVGKAIKLGETSLRSTVHIVRPEVDNGEILAVSAPMTVELPADVTPEVLSDPANKESLRRIADEHQERLKRRGDWVIYPRALELLSQGRFGFDENGLLYFDEKPIPGGVVIEETEASDGF